jgi:hypothetical protein
VLTCENDRFIDVISNTISTASLWSLNLRSNADPEGMKTRNKCRSFLSNLGDISCNKKHQTTITGIKVMHTNLLDSFTLAQIHTHHLKMDLQYTFWNIPHAPSMITEMGGGGGGGGHSLKLLWMVKMHMVWYCKVGGCRFSFVAWDIILYRKILKHT